MRTYKEFVYILEQQTGANLMFTKRLGSSGLPGSTAVTGSVQGGRPGGTQVSATGTLGRGTVSGQGDKINQGITKAIENPGQAASTSTIRKGAFGSLSANVSGGGAPKPAPKPVPKSPTQPIKPQPVQKIQPPTKPTPPVVEKPSQKPTVPSLTARGYTDDRNNPYPGSIERAGQLASDSPDPAIRAQAGQDYQAMRALQTQFKNERLAQSTGVKPVVKRADGTYGVQ